MILGRRSLTRARATEPGTVVELTREKLLSLVQTDAEIGEIVMRAYIYRRIELAAHGIGDVVLVGSAHSAGTLRIKEFLSRNGHPFGYIDLDRDADVQDLLDRFETRPPTSRCSSAAARWCCATRATSRSPTASGSTRTSIDRRSAMS